jgi:hypothetical protein
VTTVRECDYPWTGFMIWSSGSACCCCYGSSPIGDVSKESPETVWNNATMQSLRASLAAGVLHTVCHSGTCKYVVGSRATQSTTSKDVAAPKGFDETWYVARYFDVRDGIRRGLWSSGVAHYRRFGHREFRCTNEGEWERRIREEQAQTVTIPNGYSATLTWLDAPRVHEQSIVVSFSASNSGSLVWDATHRNTTPIRSSAESYRRLDDVGRVRPMYRYRGDLSKAVAPGESIALELRVPVDDLPLGRSFVVLDLVCDEKAVRFSGGTTKPLVLGVHRDESTDRVDLFAG